MRKPQSVGTPGHPFQQQQQVQTEQKGVVKAGRQAMYHGLHGCGCSLLVMVVLAHHLGLLLGTQPLQRQVRRRLSQLPSQQHVLHQACQHIKIHGSALIAINGRKQNTPMCCIHLKC